MIIGRRGDVVKSKDVQAQISIAAPEPVSPERAVELIYSVLKLEGCLCDALRSSEYSTVSA